MQWVWPRELDGISSQSNIFLPYVSKKLKLGNAHPQFLVEPVGLALVSPPDIWYDLLMDKKFWTPDANGVCHVSQPQLETIVYAIQSFHETVTYMVDYVQTTFPRGYFIGSGTGTGKTRELAGVVHECFLIDAKNKGGLQVLWVTTSTELFDGVIEEISAFDPNVKFLRKEPPTDASGQFKPGTTSNNVLITTYNQLSKSLRRQKIENWLGEDFDGLIVFDEIHKAKSAFSKKRTSEIGKCVVEIQEKYTYSKIIYSSATGASEVSHLRVMRRLGIWGIGKDFASDEDFVKGIEEMGVAGTEVLALRLKQDGVFCSRVVDFQGCRMAVLNAEVDPNFTQRFDMSCEMWQLIMKYFTYARALYAAQNEQEKGPGSGKKKKKILLPSAGGLFGDCLLYFHSLIVSSKLQTATKFARDKLREKQSAIFGLIHTGDTQYQLFKKDHWNEGMPYSNAQMILRRVLLNLGVPVGCPKYYSNDRINYMKIGKWDASDELVVNFLNPCHWTNLIDFNESVPPSNGPAEYMQSRAQMKSFPEYTVGYYLQSPHGPIEDPAQSTWDYESLRHHITKENLARLYHQLSIWLPINSMDELVERMEKPMSYVNKHGDVSCDSYAIADLTGRTTRYRLRKDDPFKWEEVMWDGTYDEGFDSKGLEPPSKRFKASCRRSSQTTPSKEESSRKPGSKKDKLKDELEAFMNKDKRVVVISAASSTGVSLHSDKGRKNRERRVHITLEYSYGPEQIVQQLGRSNRSNQKHHPEFVILNSPVPVEVRMTSVAGKRVRQLGAICYGHINGALLSDQLNDDFSTSHCAIAAVKCGLRAIYADVPEFVIPMENLIKGKRKKKKKKGKRRHRSDEEHPHDEDSEDSEAENNNNGNSNCQRHYFKTYKEERVTRVLNRLMVLPINLQKKFFAAAKARLSGSESTVHTPIKVLDLNKYRTVLLRQERLEKFDTNIRLYSISRWCRWENVVKGNYQLYRSTNKPNYYHDYVAAKQSPGDPKKFVAVFPFCKNEVLVEKDVLEDEKLWKKLTDESEIAEARSDWMIFSFNGNPFENSGAICHHIAKSACHPKKYEDSNRNCTERWGQAEFVMVTNPTLRLLNAINECKFKRTQLASIQVDTEAGKTERQNVLVIGNEEETATCQSIYNSIVLLLGGSLKVQA